jgi:hypothetical protein
MRKNQFKSEININFCSTKSKFKVEVFETIRLNLNGHSDGFFDLVIRHFEIVIRVLLDDGLSIRQPWQVQ